MNGTLEGLTAAELRAVVANARSEAVRRAARRALNDLPAAAMAEPTRISPTAVGFVLPAGWHADPHLRGELFAELGPRRRAAFSLAEVADALTRVEANYRARRRGAA